MRKRPSTFNTVPKHWPKSGAGARWETSSSLLLFLLLATYANGRFMGNCVISSSSGGGGCWLLSGRMPEARGEGKRDVGIRNPVNKRSPSEGKTS